MKVTTKELIVQTASDLFYNQGYNLTGINEIIATAGIAKATLYSHFKSKEDLCVAYLQFKDKALLEAINEFCDRTPPGDSRLVAVLEFLAHFFKSGEFNGCWCIRTFSEIPRDNKIIKDQIVKGKSKLLNFIKVLVKENKSNLPKKQQTQLAKRIYLLYEGAVSESHLQNNSWPIKENIEILKELLD